MSSPQVRRPQGQKDKKVVTPPSSQAGDFNGILKDTKLPDAVKTEWDYKVALAIITVLAFITRFWGIGHPNEVVFDEVHFGKVWKAAAVPKIYKLRSVASGVGYERHWLTRMTS